LTFPWQQIPNAITVLRILLVAPIVYCLAKEAYREALWLFVFAGISDALDGFLAREFKWSSRFGAVSDPLADKALLVAVYITLTVNGLLPLWLLAVIFFRDIIIVAGALTYHMVIGSYSMRPTIWGKLSTFSQITYVLILVLDKTVVVMPGWSIKGGLWIVASLSCVSGGHYVIVWGYKFLIALREKKT
jgi:cardiolipin synthase